MACPCLSQSKTKTWCVYMCLMGGDGARMSRKKKKKKKKTTRLLMMSNQ